MRCGLLVACWPRYVGVFSCLLCVVVRGLLVVVRCALLAVRCRCLSLVVCCLLFVVCCVPFVVCCLLSGCDGLLRVVVCCLLFNACCYVVRCLQVFVVWCLLPVARC